MKYMGSKTRIAKELLKIILKDRTRGQFYVESFAGGMNMMQHVSGNRIANDANPYLIAMWEQLTEGIWFPESISREQYSIARDMYNHPERPHNKALVGWVGWMGSYNGRFFDGGYSGHAVMGKNGKARDYITEQMNNTLKQVESLKGVNFFSGDYTDTPIPPNSIVYCDIPYKNTKQYATSKNFDYEQFYTWCEELAQKGHTVFISEYDMPEDRFECVWEKGVTNAMHQVNTKKTVERLYKVRS